MFDIAKTAVPGTGGSKNQEGCCSAVEALSPVRTFRFTAHGIELEVFKDSVDMLVLLSSKNGHTQPIRFS